jgi:hypothetical protein
VAGRLELVHTATPGERERQQDMGFPIASVMLQSMEALHWLEGCPCFKIAVFTGSNVLRAEFLVAIIFHCSNLDKKYMWSQFIVIIIIITELIHHV